MVPQKNRNMTPQKKKIYNDTTRKTIRFVVYITSKCKTHLINIHLNQ